jgi:3D-(3,5/4)-trihydroxycyclohexane-1,2-dione acylhydrolase (decyclizing)
MGSGMSGVRRLTAAQAVVSFMMAQAVERDGDEHPFFAGIFGIFGHGNVAGLGEALEAVGDRFRYHQARNEQGMVHAAAAFAKRHRRLRAFACTTSIGPGATNLVTGAAAATVNRLPVLLLPGDLFASRRVRPVLQQLESAQSEDVSVNDTLRPVSRYWDRINRPEQLISALPAAMRVLVSPAETGAVTLALPQDVQAEAFDFPTGLFEPRTHHIARARADAAVLARAAEALAASERPLIVAGGGVIYSDASATLDAFARRFGLPVAETQGGKGSLAWDHPFQVGPIGVTGGSAANRLARDADLVLAVGTRLSDFTTASWTAWQDPGVRFIGLNVAELDATKAGVPLVADARAGLEELEAILDARGWGGVPPERRAVAEELRGAWNDEVERVRHLAGSGRVSQSEAIRLVNEAAGKGGVENGVQNGVVVCAAGSLPGDLHKLWRTSRPGGYHVEYGYSTMGYEIAGGLGVKLAAPEDEVYVMVGDGSYLMLSAELATAVQEGLKLTVVLLDSHGFRSIESLARASGERNPFNAFRLRDEATGELSGAPLPIDFAANARSLGADAVVAEDARALEQALAAARKSARTTVIVAEIDPAVEVPAYDSWWDVPIAEISTSESVREARRAYEERLTTERHLL